MSKRTLAARTAGVALAAALGLGVAGPAASAATAQSARTPAALQQAPAALQQAPAAVQQAGLPATSGVTVPQSSPITAAQQAELQRAIVAGKVPAWLKRVIKELRKSPAIVMALRKAARQGYQTFKLTWDARVPKYIRKLVGSGIKLRLVYAYFRTLR
ncbi:hypothetical protein ACH35V_02480 [Actinomadura sp. 1N219]|uniref:hypothetical protein n=1 Tax=Actinomadura sp. 1N219 TaxID=3375152 RepID=UPI0037A74B5C